MNMDDAQRLQLISQIDIILSAAQRHKLPSWAGHMTPAVNEIAALGQLLASLHQGNLLSPELYPELSMLESDVFAFFCPLFGQKSGHATHGGSYGNLDALWQARKKYGDNSKRVYASDQSHYSIAKACNMLGLDLQLIASNSVQQMDITALETACKQQAPMAIVVTSGTTSSGQLDDITAIKNISQKIPCWLHIDAAWGGFLSLIDNSPLDAEQLGQADSVCFDPHKSLGQPRPSGLLMYQQTLKTTPFSTQYLTQSPRDVLPGSYGGELLLPLWLTIKTLGKTGLASQLQTKLDEAGQFASFINQQPGWWAQCSPTGIVCFTAPQPHLSGLVKKGIFSQTELKGKPVYRAVFASHTTRCEALINELARFL
jgi:glutamate/tyrosine decarboxylase-like PLP-dependent enzyme